MYRRFKGPQNPKLEPAKTPLVARRCGTPTVYQPSNAPLAGDGISLIPATRRLAEVEREMVGMTNSELRLARTLKAVREKYSVILPVAIFE